MNEEVISRLLCASFPDQIRELDPPTEDDWKALERKFRCKFPPSYKEFLRQLVKFQIPLEIYNVSTGRSNRDDPVSMVYDIEVEIGAWDEDLIPICGLGNGDYFCLRASEGEHSAVYVYDHATLSADRYSGSIEEWIRGLPAFAG